MAIVTETLVDLSVPFIFVFILVSVALVLQNRWLLRMRSQGKKGAKAGFKQEPAFADAPTLVQFGDLDLRQEIAILRARVGRLEEELEQVKQGRGVVRSSHIQEG